MNRNLIAIILMIMAGTTVGCNPSFWGGAAGGVVGTGAGYEVHAQREMERLNADLKAGKIDQKEYDIRKDQIQRDSIFQ